jgi:predicted  nucleic acid-binding Zn-ribbon protein
MAETTVPPEPENLVLRYLRRIDERLDTVDDKLDEVVDRLGRLEREIADLREDYAGLLVRFDNLDRSVARIERRLDPVEVPTAPTGQ